MRQRELAGGFSSPLQMCVNSLVRKFFDKVPFPIPLQAFRQQRIEQALESRERASAHPVKDGWRQSLANWFDDFLCLLHWTAVAEIKGTNLFSPKLLGKGFVDGTLSVTRNGQSSKGACGRSFGTTASLGGVLDFPKKSARRKTVADRMSSEEENLLPPRISSAPAQGPQKRSSFCDALTVTKLPSAARHPLRSKLSMVSRIFPSQKPVAATQRETAMQWLLQFRPAAKPNG